MPMASTSSIIPICVQTKGKRNRPRKVRGPTNSMPSRMVYLGVGLLFKFPNCRRDTVESIGGSIIQGLLLVGPYPDMAGARILVERCPLHRPVRSREDAQRCRSRRRRETKRTPGYLLSRFHGFFSIYIQTVWGHFATKSATLSSTATGGAGSFSCRRCDPQTPKVRPGFARE